MIASSKTCLISVSKSGKENTARIQQIYRTQKTQNGKYNAKNTTPEDRKVRINQTKFQKPEKKTLKT